MDYLYQKSRPMKALFVSASVLALLLFSACDKAEGCTDPSSLNFNEDARLDDGSCLYIADTYVGTYAANDSVDRFDPMTSTYNRYRRNYTFTIAKVNRGVVRLEGFNEAACSPRAAVTLTTLALESPMTDCQASNFAATFDDGVLTYTYSYDTLMPTLVTGVATWQ
jgi:hypothetical protein